MATNTAVTTESTFEYKIEFLTSVKDSLCDEVSKCPDDYDSVILNQWFNDVDYFLRYVKRKRGDLNSTVLFLLEILRWRKKNNISNLTELSFPKEFYDFAGVHIYGEDRDGNIICHIRICLFYKQPEILDLLKKFIIFQMFKADELSSSKGKGWILLYDCTGSGVANADHEMVNFISSTLRDYFPVGQMYVLIHNLPWLLNAIKTFVFSFLPANVKKRIKFSNDKSIEEFIDRSNLPPYMNGTSAQIYPGLIPTGVVSTKDMVKMKILPLNSEEELRVEKYYEKIYNQIESVSQSK